MEINIPRPQLTKALELISRISIKHVTLPVLQCVLITAKKEGIVLRATNLELSIEVGLDGRVVEEGVIAVPANTLLSSINYINEAEVTLRTEDQVLLIESKNTNTSIKSIANDEFPNIYHLEGEGVEVNRSLFALGIKTVVFAASPSTIKPELGSVYVQQKKEHSLTFVATDSFRLVEKTVPQKNLILRAPFLIPQKNATELVRVCELLATDPKLVVTENQCALDFSEEKVYVTSRLVAGSFPDYEQIFPKEYVTHVTLLRGDLVNAFKKTSIFLNKFFKVSIIINDNSITVSAQNSDVGYTTDSVAGVVKGEDLTINFNQHFLIEVLPHFQDESLSLHFAGLGRPLVIGGHSDTTLRCLVMPMNR